MGRLEALYERRNVVSAEVDRLLRKESEEGLTPEEGARLAESTEEYQRLYTQCGQLQPGSTAAAG